MDALVSGEAGVALVLDGTSIRSLHTGGSGEAIVRKQEEIHLLIGDARDLQVLENVTEEEVAHQLRRAAARIDGLQLILILLDASLADDTRQEAAGEAEELLAQASVAVAVEDILYGHPLPDAADPAGALSFCATRAPRTAQLLRDLMGRQTLIVEVHQAWQQVTDAAIGLAADRAYVQAAFVRNGLFRKLVIEREAGRRVDAFLVDALLQRDITGLPSHRAILRSWIEPLQRGREQRHFEEQRVEVADLIAEGDARAYRRGFDRLKKLGKVETQKAAIVEAMRVKDLPRARSYVAELIKSQTGGGQDPVYACMSLCDLAAKAKALSLSNMQLELSEAATKLKANDAWSWVQYADALLEVGRLDAALAATENAVGYGERAVGNNVRAEVLRALGRLDESLAVYDEVVENFPDNEVARNGRAEVLRSMNRLEEALTAYDSVIIEFPESAVARSGRAEVLRSMSRFEEALTAYDSVIVEFPQNVVARNGRAEVLRSLNRLEEALAAYDSVIVEFPQDVVARNGRAEVLRSLNRLEEALAAYDSVIGEFPQNVVARNGRAEALRSLSRLEEALAAYDSVIVEFPQNVVAKNGRAEALRSMSRLAEALAAYDEIRRVNPYDLVVRNGRAVVLASLGRWDEALADLPKEPPSLVQDWIGYHIRGMALLRSGRIDAAHEVFSAGVHGNAPAEEKDYFRSALALTNLQRGRVSAAGQSLNEVKSPTIEPFANLLRLHVFCALGERELAIEADRRVAAVAAPGVQAVRRELRRRFLGDERPLHSDQWILEQETGLLFAAIGTLLSFRRMRPLSA